MLMTFDALATINKMSDKARLLFAVMSGGFVILMDLMHLIWHTNTLGAGTVVLILWGLVLLVTGRIERRATQTIVAITPVRLIGCTFGQMGKDKMLSVTFICLDCDEQTTLELKDEQYEKLARGVQTFARVVGVEIRLIRPVKRYKRTVRIEHQDKPIELTCRLECKDSLELGDLMLRYLGGLMYEKVALQLEGELKRIVAEFAGRPLSEFVEFIRGFGLELEGMPYRARVKRVKEVKVKPASTRAGQ